MSAKETYDTLSESAKGEPVTKFLLYKIALRSKDIELTAQCLQELSFNSQDPRLLHACVLDAQQSGNKEEVLRALQVILDTHGPEQTEALHLPALLRIMISLMQNKLSDLVYEVRPDEISSSSQTLCQLFSTGMWRSSKMQVSDTIST